MRAGYDIAKKFPGLLIVHHNKPGQHTEAHAHGEHHLILPLRGDFRIKTADLEIAVGPGRMVYVPARLAHEFLASGTKEGERLIVLISPQLWKSAKGGRFAFGAYPASQLAKELLFHLLLHPKAPSVRALTGAFLSVLFETLASDRELGSSENQIQHTLARATDPRLKRAVDFLSEHFAESELKVEGLGKVSGLSPRNLNRLARTELGLGPKEILIRLRLEEARRLLTETSVSVTEASFRVGYGSLSRFIQAFRAFYGVLPSERR